MGPCRLYHGRISERRNVPILLAHVHVWLEIILFLCYVGAKLTPPVTTIREQATEEQQRYWMPRILNYDIIGCYAQTELGHGSNVRGLETTAKWDPVRQEFEIHSPYLTASKWWNGSMGRTATHSVRRVVIPHCTHHEANARCRSWLHSCFYQPKMSRQRIRVTARKLLSCRFGTRGSPAAPRNCCRRYRPEIRLRIHGQRIHVI
jgi:alkylation response protein AidB-like acyl-CoA dehydrogenase